VLDIKAKQEVIKTQELFALTEKLAQARGELLAQQRILRDILESIANEKPKNRLNKQEFFLRHSAATDERIKQLRAKADELEAKQRDKIAEVLKIRRFKESLERLREQAKKRYIEEQEKLEQKQLDETATLSFARPGTARGFAGTSESRQSAKGADDEDKNVQSIELTTGLQENQK
jgi:flagellar biosynthesis chaperone FliJ